MKINKYILAATAILMGFVSCSKEEYEAEPVQEPQFVDVTVGAGFAATRTTMASNGDVIWSATDKIKVQVNSNSYDFELKSGSNTTSAVFHAVVTSEDAEILKGTKQGTVSAYYPTSGAEVPETQTYAEGTFADEMNPMTATFEAPNFTFTNNAAVVRIQGVSKDATSAVLSYTVDETPYTVTMALTAGETAKDLYFVVVPGAKEFNLALDGGSPLTYKASANTEAGSRYNLIIPAAMIGDAEYGSLAAAFAAVQSGQTIKMISDHEIGGQYTMGEPLVLSTDNVTIDLNGKKVTVTQNLGMDIAANNATIKNGTLKAGTNTGKQSGINSYAIAIAHITKDQKVSGIVLQDVSLKGGIFVGSSIGDTKFEGGADVTLKNCDIESGDWYDIYASCKSSVIVESGKYFSFHHENWEDISTEDEATVSLKGGIYDSNVGLANLVADGYKLSDNADDQTKAKYPYAVVVEPATEVSSESALVSAIANASSGEVIKLMQDITLTSQLNINKNVIVNLNGKTITPNSSLTAEEENLRPIVITANGVVLKNGTVDGKNVHAGMAMINVHNDCTLNNIVAITPGIAARVRTANTLTIKGASSVYTSTGNYQGDANVNNRCYETALCTHSCGVINIEAGTFTGRYYAVTIMNSGGTINIFGGTFNKGKVQNEEEEGNGLAYAFLNDGNNTEAKQGKITISGNPVIHGSFRGRVNNQAGHYGFLTFNGGTFDSDCELFNFNQNRIILSESYEIQANGECKDKGYSSTTGNGKRWKLITK